jgi:2-C-methyl-D-erythritol 4-phosphate cytidylyltransferase
MKTVAIIPAGGAGRRMGSGTAKQYLLLDGIPLLVHALRAFQDTPAIHEIFLAVPQADIDRVRRELVEGFGLSKVTRVLAGGAERQDSVGNALSAVGEDREIVVIHDGVRPFVTGELIERVVDGAARFGAVTVGVPVRDTVKAVDPAGQVVRTVPREGLWLTQTPQAFRRELIRQAYERAAAEGFYGTDDASLAERAGIPVRMLSGQGDNIKVTAPEDLALGERILRSRGAKPAPADRRQGEGP